MQHLRGKAIRGVTIVQKQEISAIYYASLQTGYDFYALEKEPSLVRDIAGFKQEAPDFDASFFGQVQQGLCPTFRTLEPHGKIVSAQQGFVRISRTVLYPNIGGRISAGLSQTPRRI